MSISLNARIAPAPGVLMQELDGEAVFLSFQSERYFGLDEIGTRMWKVLTSSNSLREASDQLATEYDVSAEELRQDLLELVGQLMQHQLVEVHHG